MKVWQQSTISLCTNVSGVLQKLKKQVAFSPLSIKTKHQTGDVNSTDLKTKYKACNGGEFDNNKLIICFLVFLSQK